MSGAKSPLRNCAIAILSGVTAVLFAGYAGLLYKNHPFIGRFCIILTDWCYWILPIMMIYAALSLLAHTNKNRRVIVIIAFAIMLFWSPVNILLSHTYVNNGVSSPLIEDFYDQFPLVPLFFAIGAIMIELPLYYYMFIGSNKQSRR